MSLRCPPFQNSKISLLPPTLDDQLNLGSRQCAWISIFSDQLTPRIKRLVLFYAYNSRVIKERGTKYCHWEEYWSKEKIWDTIVLGFQIKLRDELPQHGKGRRVLQTMFTFSVKVVLGMGRKLNILIIKKSRSLYLHTNLPSKDI